MGLFDKIADVAEDVGTGIFSKALKPAGKGILRGLREYDERVLDPLMAQYVQAGASINEDTFVFDFGRLVKGQQPFVHGRRTFFDNEITPRDTDYLEIAFGKGASRRREHEKARATIEEAGLTAEILTKTALDPFNVFIVKQGTVVPAYKGARAAVRGVRSVLTGSKRVVAREALLAENRRLKTLVQAGQATPEDEARLLAVRSGLQATDIDYVAGMEEALQQAGLKPVAGGASKMALNEGIPDLGEMAATIMSEQARESAVLASRPARPFRFLTNRFFGSANTAKAESLDAVVPLEAAKFEQFGTGADLAAVLTDDQFRALGLVAQFDDELITLNSGVKVSMRHLMEKTGGLK
ncbi:hypothetical protein LCGC14_2191200, partial [marine sediment metagenome]